MKKIFMLLTVVLIMVITGCHSGSDSTPTPTPLSSEKAITEFSLNGVVGTINETKSTIAVTMPYGTSGTVLVATFTTTGDKVEVGSTVQTSGETPNDFIDPVVYTVTAADSSTQNYTVTVTRAAPIYQFVTQWGSQGGENGQFSSPEGIAVDASGNVYVADSGNDRIQVFSSSGVYITRWGGNGQFHSPEGIAVDASGIVYVVDRNDRIQVFSSSGVYITRWGSIGTGNGQFISPKGIAVDASGNVYVADTENNRIQVFSPQ